MLRPNKKIEETIQAANERNRRKFPNRAGLSGARRKTMGGIGDAYNRRRGTGKVIEQYGLRGSRGGRRRGGRGGLGLNPNAPNDLVTGKGGRKIVRRNPYKNFKTFGKYLDARGGGRVGTGLAGSRRRTSSSGGRRRMGRTPSERRAHLDHHRKMQRAARKRRANPRAAQRRSIARGEHRIDRSGRKAPVQYGASGGRGGRRGTSSGPASRLSDRQRQKMKNRFGKAAADSRARRFGYRHRNRRGIMAGDGSRALRGRNTRPAPKNRPRVMGMPRQIENRYRRRR